MDTTNLLLERELLIKKLEYAKQKLFDISANLNFGYKTKDEIADDAYKTIEILNDKDKVW